MLGRLRITIAESSD